MSMVHDVLHCTPFLYVLKFCLSFLGGFFLIIVLIDDSLKYWSVKSYSIF
jgi:hypothetical protein